MMEEILMKYGGHAERVAAPRVIVSEIPALFKEIDKDNSGSLDQDELRAFFLGRYDITREVADNIFKKYDTDESKSIELKEFTTIVEAINAIVQKFDTKEEKSMIYNLQCITCCTLYSCCCCLPTLGTSCWCGAACNACTITKMEASERTKVARLNETLSKVRRGRRRRRRIVINTFI